MPPNTQPLKSTHLEPLETFLVRHIQPIGRRRRSEIPEQALTVGAPPQDIVPVDVPVHHALGVELRAGRSYAARDAKRLMGWGWGTGGLGLEVSKGDWGPRCIFLDVGNTPVRILFCVCKQRRIQG